MASRFLSVGDLLMLSQQAWSLSRAFGPGKKSVPSIFGEVEHAANRLSGALKAIAETLQNDGSLLQSAESQLTNAVNGILQSAADMLCDFDNFADSYQVIRKRKTDGGFMVEKTWAPDVLENYETIAWTTEGAVISEVMDLLRLHTSTIELSTQALQLGSLETLERVVLPIAATLANAQGDVASTITGLRSRIGQVLEEVPFLAVRDPDVIRECLLLRPTSDGAGARDVIRDEAPKLHSSTGVSTSPSVKKASPRPHDSVHSTPALEALPRIRDDSRSSSGGLPLAAEGGRTKQYARTSAPNDVECALQDVTANSQRSLLQQPSKPVATAARRESATLPNRFELDDPIAEGLSRTRDSKRITISSDEILNLSIDSEISLPPYEPAETTATPSSVSFRIPRHTRGGSTTGNQSTSAGKTAKADVESTSSALRTLPAFERHLFRNAAILCDVRGKMIEYARKIPDVVDARYDTEMVEACKECRICVVRKRENRPNGGTKTTTSIWAISEDGVARCQQRLTDSIETVPYRSYFEQEKVSIPPIEGGLMTLEFRGEEWGGELERREQTSWVNYFLSSENDGVAFQSAVYGRLLIGSFRTTKTTVIHDGLRGAFAFEEQFANIEMLRLFQDDGLATPGGSGGVLALMHISSNFGEGWARWWMNCSRQEVRVKADGAKHARLKGIDISVVKPGQMVSMGDKIRNKALRGEMQKMHTESLAKSAGKPVPIKRVTGIRVEFNEEEERDLFLEMIQRVQKRLIPLPTL